MVQLLQAREPADQIYDHVRIGGKELNEAGIQLQLAVVIVEGDPASAYYARSKQKIAERLGVLFQLHMLPSDVIEAEVIQLVEALNADPAVHGIMVELPLPGHIRTDAVISLVNPLKDIDGGTEANKLAVWTGAEGLYPATPQACIRLLQHYRYTLRGSNVTVIGRGQTVGMPLIAMLLRENATVTVCHSHTKNLHEHLLQAEIVVAAAGSVNIITEAMVHPDLVVIDAGINELADGTIVGDAAPGIAEHVRALSPVPGGVGTLTTAILFENLLKAAHLQLTGKGANV